VSALRVSILVLRVGRTGVTDQRQLKQIKTTKGPCCAAQIISTSIDVSNANCILGDGCSRGSQTHGGCGGDGVDVG